MTYRTLLFAGLTATIMLTPMVAASGQSRIYTPGTDCANQPTIAARLLCGRQEFRREQGLSNTQPAPLDESGRIEGQVPLPSADEMAPRALPVPRADSSQQRTSSPAH